MKNPAAIATAIMSACYFWLPISQGMLTVICASLVTYFVIKEVQSSRHQDTPATLEQDGQ